MANLKIAGLCKDYGPVEVLKNIDLDIKDGEFVVFVGPSGCGKSTLLRMICGLDEVTSGALAIGDQIVNDVPSSKRGIAMVFQSYALYPHMSVAKNMGYALRLAGEDASEIDRRVKAAAEILKIDHLLDRKPRQLSGGQRQRVAIGRAIVREPEVFLFDEPLSNLDAALRVDMRMEFARLKKRLGTTMIYVTHDQVEAMTLADKIVVMNAGRVEQVGAPIELYHAPMNRFVAEFIGSPRMNILPAGLVADAPAGADTVGLRPEQLVLGEAGLRGKVLTTERLGSDTFAYVEIDGLERPLVVRKGGDEALASGLDVTVGWGADALYAFDAEGRALQVAPLKAAS
ncbi:Maltose/maltodextrin transport ATP-binding protein MalK [Candidatus Rhodobacter oscarellae]|uniref:Maltose/maltodextrin transport ATP-binding protein MalK n=1 Tax=Candidatus Rhodobacter oscarellae TaxID=1675527 RepID=A0A0J9E6L5_9RHOB|nr:sn-glycerol-3-phosphate ABC transporter ATP-binding protein UgpC [Candidatus Rhodobacter lobularis]KMW58327.1 Maltose/maltodextrin transport ATP-binding protein MalK [Candidatus Rhodobacter lobularis]